jgi:hypothetical protein
MRSAIGERGYGIDTALQRVAARSSQCATLSQLASATAQVDTGNAVQAADGSFDGITLDRPSVDSQVLFIEQGMTIQSRFHDSPFLRLIPH